MKMCMTLFDLLDSLQVNGKCLKLKFIYDYRLQNYYYYHPISRENGIIIVYTEPYNFKIPFPLEREM